MKQVPDSHKYSMVLINVTRGSSSTMSDNTLRLTAFGSPVAGVSWVHLGEEPGILPLYLHMAGSKKKVGTSSVIYTFLPLASRKLRVAFSSALGTPRPYHQAVRMTVLISFVSATVSNINLNSGLLSTGTALCM